MSVVVASHARRLRLRWLLNALEEQSLAPDRFEVVVAHDYDDATAERVMASHPLARAGRLRQIAIPAGTGSPSRQRNLGWRAARGELVAFTDDDCRPEPDWLERLLAVAGAHRGAVVQGATRPDPMEEALLHAPHVRTHFIDPVNVNAQACNILYPRALLERLGGFDERAIAGEDTDLVLRAKAQGSEVAAAPDAVVNHAVESHTLPGILRQNLKWRHLAYLTKRHPELRVELPLGVFWDRDHLLTTAASVGILAGRRYPPLVALAFPYLVRAARRPGRSRRRAIAEIPGQAVRQVAEVLGMVVGSARHRTLLL